MLWLLNPHLDPRWLELGGLREAILATSIMAARETEVQRGKTVWSIRSSHPHSHEGCSHSSGWPLSSPSRASLALGAGGRHRGWGQQIEGRRGKPQLPVVVLGRLDLICSQSGSPDRTGPCSPWIPGNPTFRGSSGVTLNPHSRSSHVTAPLPVVCVWGEEGVSPSSPLMGKGLQPWKIPGSIGTFKVSG